MALTAPLPNNPLPCASATASPRLRRCGKSYWHSKVCCKAAAAFKCTTRESSSELAGGRKRPITSGCCYSSIKAEVAAAKESDVVADTFSLLPRMRMAPSVALVAALPAAMSEHRTVR